MGDCVVSLADCPWKDGRSVTAARSLSVTSPTFRIQLDI